MVGNDWGARAAYIASYLLTDKVRHCISISVGYGTTNTNQEMSLKQIKNYWYHWYMATECGKELVEKNRRKFCRFMWRPGLLSGNLQMRNLMKPRPLLEVKIGQSS